MEALLSHRFSNASSPLIGPGTMLPMPLPVERNSVTMVGSARANRDNVVLTVPGYVVL